MRVMLKSSWKCADVTQVQEESVLHKGLYIWAFHWDKIPHLGLSLNGRYFSTTINGNQLGEETDKFFRLAKRKMIPCFLVKLEENQFQNLNFEVLLQEFNIDLSTAETCLYPIKKVLSHDYEKIDTLAKLIVQLEKETTISAYLTIQAVQEIYLNAYCKNDVLKMIKKQLNHATRE